MLKTSFVPDGKPRVPNNGDYIKMKDGGFWRVNVPSVLRSFSVQQCYLCIEEEVPDPDPQPVAYLYRRTGEERKPVDGEYIDRIGGCDG